MDNIELTTMCAIVKDKMVLMINRRKNWKGWAFPGGHLEQGESMVECVSREMIEETGLTVCNLQYRGITHFYNTKNAKRHIISNFVCTDHRGEPKTNCEEGELRWIEIKDLEKYELAEGMKYRLPLFFGEKTMELYIEWDEESGYTEITYNEL